jgi:ABC-type antimicrobial peptide transport system permease subunit
MKTFDIVRRAGRSLKHAKARTILTSLAIAVGAFTLTIAIAAGEGARQYANTLLTTNMTHKFWRLQRIKVFSRVAKLVPKSTILTRVY